MGDQIPIGARILRVCDVLCSAHIGQTISGLRLMYATVMELMIDEIKNFDMEVFLAFQRVVHNNE
ncbi:MAG: hypothetical protein ACLTX6_10715 [Lachnospiraceae bacterium]